MSTRMERLICIELLLSLDDDTESVSMATNGFSFRVRTMFTCGEEVEQL